MRRFRGSRALLRDQPESIPGTGRLDDQDDQDTPFHVLLETLKVNADVDMRAELPKIQVPP